MCVADDGVVVASRLAAGIARHAACDEVEDRGNDLIGDDGH